MTARRWRIAALLFTMLLFLGTTAASFGLTGHLLDPIYDFPFGDKIAHFTLSGILALLAGLGFAPRRIRLGFFQPLISSLVIAFLISMEEVTHILLATRDFDLSDLAAGLLGIILLGEIGARLNPKDKNQ